VLVELATRYARRSASSSLIWHHHRKFYDKSMVLLPLLVVVSEAFDFIDVRPFFKISVKSS
jgi:hypothetical protein